MFKPKSSKKCFCGKCSELMFDLQCGTSVPIKLHAEQDSNPARASISKCKGQKCQYKQWCCNTSVALSQAKHQQHIKKENTEALSTAHESQHGTLLFAKQQLSLYCTRYLVDGCLAGGLYPNAVVVLQQSQQRTLLSAEQQLRLQPVVQPHGLIPSH